MYLWGMGGHPTSAHRAVIVIDGPDTLVLRVRGQNSPVTTGQRNEVDHRARNKTCGTAAGARDSILL